jgi:SAM-dependent methyltransferase
VTGRELWHRVWKYREKQRRRTNSFVIGEVEQPMAGDRCVHVLDVKGWARGRHGEPAIVRLEVNGTRIHEVSADGPRPELATKYPDVPGIAGGGFRALLKASDLPGGAMLWLTVTAAIDRGGPHGIGPDGSGTDRVETLSAFPVLRGKGLGSPTPRHAYGKVWDQSASKLLNARLSVAGYADEDEWQRSGRSSADTIATAMGIGPEDVVLEIGCGTARIGTHLAPRCRQWIGCDVSQNMLTFAREALAGVPNVSLVHLNGYDLEGVADGSADVVYCSAVFMHLEEWDRYRYVCEAFRVLRPGGRVYYDNFNLLSAEGWALFEESSRLDVAMRPPNVSKSSTPEELRCYAERAGFEGIGVDTGGIFVTIRARKPTR